jgi:XTP/dITP diphosphohydrolase
MNEDLDELLNEVHKKIEELINERDPMKTIVLASNNEHKIKEFKEMLPDYNVLSLKDINFLEEIEETGTTFEENSLLKAKTIHDYLKGNHPEYIVIADDSGLCCEALDGAPGVYSARYAGEHGNNEANRAKLQKELKGKDRTAYFNCTIVVYYPDETYKVFVGKTYGTISTKEIGDKSFGYDCIFLSEDLNKTFGEATEEEKNSVSHRGRAIMSMLKEI